MNIEQDICLIQKELKDELRWRSEEYDMEYKPDVVVDFMWYSFVINPEEIELINRIFEKHSYKMSYLSVRPYDGYAKSFEDCYLVMRFIKTEEEI